jgi:membrane-associated phospholipid phosphatase
MKIAVAAPLAESVLLYSAVSRTTTYRTCEKVALAYFAYVAVVLSFETVPNYRYSLALLIPFLVAAAVALEARYSVPWSRVLRDWAPLGLILLAYREVEWFAGKPALVDLERIWVGWDHVLLYDAGMRTTLESTGRFIPSLLEVTYLLLYALPAACMGALYWYGQRSRIDRLLTTLLVGTFCVYALLPYFPTNPPRVAFPAEDSMLTGSLWRTINIWLFEHCDISTSVFPSGHVAVAFSSAFGLLRAMPERRWLYFSVFTIAVIVVIATVYCRYHYAVDGLASIGVSVFAWLSTAAMDRDV